MNQTFLDITTKVGNKTAKMISSKNAWKNACGSVKNTLSDGWQAQKEQWADDISSLGESEGGGFGGEQVMQLVGSGLQLASNAVSSAQIKDTSGYQNQIDQLKGIGNQRYNDFDAIEQDYQQIDNLMPDVNYDSIRGVNELGEFGSVLSSGLSGASAGFSVGGPWGAAAGAIIGAGTGLVGVLTGDSKAALETGRLQNEADAARLRATQNLDRRREELRDYRFSQGAMNVASEGGMIQKRTQSIQEFAKRALGTPRRKEETSTFRIVRQACDGGVRIRLKR